MFYGSTHTSKQHANGHSLWVCENVTSHAVRAANRSALLSCTCWTTGKSTACQMLRAKISRQTFAHACHSNNMYCARACHSITMYPDSLSTYKHGKCMLIWSSKHTRYAQSYLSLAVILNCQCMLHHRWLWLYRNDIRYASEAISTHLP